MLWFEVNRKSQVSLTKQVYQHIRELILDEQLIEHTRLPSSREMADQIGVSRNTVLAAYEQLLYEGYIYMKEKSGSYVAPGVALQVGITTDFRQTKSHQPKIEKMIDFRAAHPAIDHFPRKVWGKLIKDICYDIDNEIFGYGTSNGEEKLRASLANYLGRTRSVKCHRDQIVITSGATQALYLITRLLASQKGRIAVEDPVTDEMRGIFVQAGANLLPISMDNEGIIPRELPTDTAPSFVFVIPSHQFPTGITLSIQRRIQLVEYARKMNTFIVEDDYDSEFTYEGTAVSSMQSLDPNTVIYVGTFSKILSPAIRIGYVVLPPALIEPFQALKWYADRHTSTMEQLAMARFIEEGYLEQHIRKMKRIYQKRRATLVDELAKYFPSCKLIGEAAGMHLVVEMHNIIFEKSLLKKLQEADVQVYPVEHYAMKKGHHLNQIVLGYGSLTEDQIKEGVLRIATVINQLHL
ncbi:PLP-dependent aminotransferase family protein [Alkalihalobacillus pseudalcaliphilus]|uniref:MocR-like pyridoxine biosynthesis transcription factor PdxR n=1 Tax=Alkalihalobacillus pseudalcaliphilus TaxID=79884 RepID=UPI00064E0279|nr:PLP-dependent aminotransferase family protein [Alkalihalobacillus pseudalcaliphilus]KMK76246.1 GntR family transcriptional regulator [Alkalihalobacillus pseudalcaliphilus]